MWLVGLSPAAQPQLVRRASDSVAATTMPRQGRRLLDKGHERSPLHAALIQSKLESFRKVVSDDLIGSLRPGRPRALKPRPDGTILDGHHRIAVLRERGVDVNALPREIMPRAESEQD